MHRPARDPALGEDIDDGAEATVAMVAPNVAASVTLSGRALPVPATAVRTPTADAGTASARIIPPRLARVTARAARLAAAKVPGKPRIFAFSTAAAERTLPG